MDQRNFNQVGTLVRMGSEILSFAQLVLRAERLNNNHSVKAPSKAAWPSYFLETESEGDRIAQISYRAKDITKSWMVFETLAKLPYDNEDKKMVLRYVKDLTNRRSWARAKADRHWIENRRTGEKILIHLVQELSRGV